MADEAVSMKTMPANLARGGWGLLGLLFMTAGAAVLWGIGGGLFALGLFMGIDASFDEMTERVTGVKRERRT